MDPLTAVLATIALATAIKDIVETAQAIQDAFSKLPNNFRNARKLAEEVFTTLQEMQEIYTENAAVFNRAKHLARALHSLQVKMKSVHEQCLPLLPPVSVKWMGRLKMAFYAFRNRSKVEQLISELKDHVDRCSQQFLVLSNLRTEALVTEICDVLRSVNITNAHLVEFMHSTPMPMTRIAGDISERDLSNAYLRRQVGVVERTLQSKLLYWLQESPADFELPSFHKFWDLVGKPRSSLSIHQGAVMLAFQVQTFLAAQDSHSLIVKIDAAIRDLSVNFLAGLHMIEEAIMLNTLRVNLWKAMCTKYPALRAPSTFLVHSLTTLADLYNVIGDRRQAYLRSNEATTIIAELPDATLEEINMLGLNMVLQSMLEQDSDRAIKLATSAGNIFKYLHYVVDKISTTIRLSSLDHIINMPPSGINLVAIDRSISHEWQFTLAKALSQVARNFCSVGQCLDSNSCGKMALETLRHLHGFYPGSRVVLYELVDAFRHVLLMPVCGKSSTAEKSANIRGLVSTIRELAQFDSQKYVMLLMEALWNEIEHLLRQDRSLDAQNVYQEMVNLGDLAAAPRHLGLKIPSEVEGDYFLAITKVHLEMNQPMDAISAAQTAYTQYSALDAMNPGKFPLKCAVAMTWLCGSFVASKKYDLALAEGFRALEIIDSLVDLHVSQFNRTPIADYQRLLGWMMEALAEFPLSCPSRPTQTQVTSIRKRSDSLLRRCAKFSADMLEMVIANEKYFDKLQRNMCIDLEALVVSHPQDVYVKLHIMLEEIVDKKLQIGRCGELLGATNMSSGTYTSASSRENESSRQCANMGPNIFWDTNAKTGKVNFTLELPSIKLGPSNPKPLRILTFEVADKIGIQRSLLHKLASLFAGQYKVDAQNLSLTMVSDVRSNILPDQSLSNVAALDNVTRCIIQELNCLSSVQFFRLSPLEPIATARRAISLCQTELPLIKDQPRNLQLLYGSLYQACEALSDLGEVDTALICWEEANKVAESYEISRLLTLRSKLLFAKGPQYHIEAAKLIKRVESFLRRILKADFTFALYNLAQTLHYSRIVYCSVGWHDEGVAAATGLKKLEEIAALGPINNFAHEIQLAIDFMMERGSWKSVQEAKDKLTCTVFYHYFAHYHSFAHLRFSSSVSAQTLRYLVHQCK